MKHIACITLLGLCALALLSAPVHAAGGIYFDDLLVTNNGQVISSDNFDDGNTIGWNSLRDATLSSAQSHSGSRSLLLDWHGNSDAYAYCPKNIAQADLVEASAWVYLPAVAEQYYWSHNTVSFTGICISPQDPGAMMADVELWPGEAGYRLRLGWSNGATSNDVTTVSSVITPGSWNQLTLRMDQSTSTASILLNGQQQLSSSYDPSHFQTIVGTTLRGWLGDHQPVDTPEPSSILALITGLASIGGMICRRKK